MKKYFIFAVAAVVAMAACTKTEIDETVVPEKKIGFEVANYARQTKANISLANEEKIYQFHTYAYQFPKLGNPVDFMNVDIFPWNVAGSTRTQITAANDESYVISEWAPAEDYFWPKTGYINFYSYAANDTSLNPTESVDGTKKAVTLTYTDKVIDANANILVADAALHYSNSNSQTYNVDDSETSGHVTKGVPTLFHHQLAKVKFDVRARTTEAKKSENTIWKIQVLGTYGTGADEIKSTIKPINKGSLVLTNTDALAADAAAQTQAWTLSYTDATDVSGWRPSTVATDKEEIVFLSTADIASAPEVLTIPVGKIESVDASNKAYDPVEILALRSVMPQLTANVAFTLVYKVQALHGTTVFMEEIRTVGIDAAAALGSIRLGNASGESPAPNTVASWLANKKITYHIIIDPISEKVTFDPAVEDFDPIDADGAAHSDTENDDPNVNEGGII